MKPSDPSIESLITSGLIGSFLGTLLAKDKEEGAIIGAFVGAAISATAKASKAAKEINIPQMMEENGNLFEITTSGEKRLIKKLHKSENRLPLQFKLK